jgi:mRNA interferase HigB
VRIISLRRLREFWADEPEAKVPLKRWHRITKGAAWKGPAEVKQAFGVNVDFVKVRSGRTVAVIDIGANKFRLIAAIHYQAVHFRKGRVYVLRIMDHREYDRNKWVDEL